MPSEQLFSLKGLAVSIAALVGATYTYRSITSSSGGMSKSNIEEYKRKRRRREMRSSQFSFGSLPTSESLDDSASASSSSPVPSSDRVFISRSEHSTPVSSPNRNDRRDRRKANISKDEGSLSSSSSSSNSRDAAISKRNRGPRPPEQVAPLSPEEEEPASDDIFMNLLSLYSDEGVFNNDSKQSSSSRPIRKSRTYSYSQKARAQRKRGSRKNLAPPTGLTRNRSNSSPDVLRHASFGT